MTPTIADDIRTFHGEVKTKIHDIILIDRQNVNVSSEDIAGKIVRSIFGEIMEKEEDKK